MATSRADAPLTLSSGLEKSIEGFLRYLQKERNYAANTVDAYRRDLLQFARFLYPRVADPRLPLTSIRPALVGAFLDELNNKDLQNSTVARKLAAVRALFRFLGRQQIVAGNPASGLSAPPFAPNPPLALKLDQVEKMIALPAAEGFAGTRNRAILELFYGSGIRLSELVGLNLSALALEEGTVRVVGQGRKERIVPVGSKATDTLKRYLQIRADRLVDLDITQVEAGALFLNNRGRRLHRRTVQRIVERYLRQLKIGPQQVMSPHRLRHTFATHLVGAGADPAAVKALLGHSTTAAIALPQEAPSLEHLQRIYAKAHPRAD